MKRKPGQWISRRPWTDNDVRQLHQLQLCSKQHVAKKLNRSVCAVELKARKLGITFPRQSYKRPNDIVRPWTKKERLQILDMAGTMTIAEAAKKIDRTKWALVDQLRRMSIRWNRGHYRLWQVAKILQVAETTVRRHRNKLRQHWRIIGNNGYSSVIGASDTQIQALAFSLLDNIRSVGASYKHLKRVSEGDWNPLHFIRKDT